MAYLLDTSTLAELLRASPPRPLVRRLSQVAPADRWTSVISVSQLLLAARQQDDARVMQDVVRLVAAIRVAPYDLGAAQAFAKFRASQTKDGATEDFMVAAIAASRELTMVTRRVSDFQRFDLPVEDWTR